MRHAQGTLFKTLYTQGLAEFMKLSQKHLKTGPGRNMFLPKDMKITAIQPKRCSSQMDRDARSVLVHLLAMHVIQSNGLHCSARHIEFKVFPSPSADLVSYTMRHLHLRHTGATRAYCTDA